MIKKKKHNCPFCSSNKIKIVIDKEYPGRMLMGLCTNCRCCGGHGDTVSKTIDSWNSYVEEVWKARKEDKKNNYADWEESMFTMHNCLNCFYSYFRGCKSYCSNKNRYSKIKHPLCTEYEFILGCEEWKSAKIKPRSDK